MQTDKRRYADIFKNDFYRVNEALIGKDPVTIQKEAFANEVAKSKHTHPEDEYTWISNGIDLGWLGEYQGWGRAIKGLPRSGNFTTQVPKTANANSKLPVVGKTENYDKQTSTIHISSGAENVALYPKLKEQLRQANLSNIVAKSPILEHAAFGKGNLTIKGTITNKEAENLAIEWIGEKPIFTSNGGMISSDDTRCYEPVSIKKNSQYVETGIQANFERGYTDNSGKFIPQSNLHLNIKKD